MDLISTVAESLALRLLWAGLDEVLDLPSQEPMEDPDSHCADVDAK